MALADGIEIIGYIFGFWLFMFSKKFRINWISEFSSGNKTAKFFSILEAICATFCGLIGPIWLVVHFLLSRGAST